MLVLWVANKPQYPLYIYNYIHIQSAFYIHKFQEKPQKMATKNTKKKEPFFASPHVYNINFIQLTNYRLAQKKL